MIYFQLINWRNGKLEFNEDVMQNISRKIPDNIPIAVVVVTGDYRTGKSSLLNIFIYVLEYIEKHESLEGFNRRDIRFNIGCLNKGLFRNKNNGFGWKSGEDSCTKGINILSRPFIIPIPNNKLKKMAVLLVDSEGLQANDSTGGEDQVLYGLSDIMASLLIVNNKGFIGTTDLRNIKILAEFCPPDNSKATFCSLDLLMRDFKYETTDLNDQLIEIENFRKKLLKSNDEGIRNVFIHIFIVNE